MAKIYILCSKQYLRTYRTLNKYLGQNEFTGQKKNGLIWTSAINVSIVIKETYTEQQQQEENKIQLFEAQRNLV